MFARLPGNMSPLKVAKLPMIFLGKMALGYGSTVHMFTVPKKSVRYKKLLFTFHDFGGVCRSLTVFDDFESNKNWVVICCHPSFFKKKECDFES